MLFIFITKQVTYNEEVNCTQPFPLVSAFFSRALVTIIQRKLLLLTVENAKGYYATELITTVKSFIVQACAIKYKIYRFPCHGRLYRGIHTEGRMNTVDLLVPTSSDQLLFVLKLYFSFFKTTYLNEDVLCNEPFPSVRVPCLHISSLCKISNYILTFFSLSVVSAVARLKPPTLE